MHARAIYRALLFCYPSAFRHEYGQQMLLVFDAELTDARRAGRLEPFIVWGHAMLDALTIAPREHAHVILQDLRYAGRTMAARPTFTAVAVLTLALGIGANTAIFSVWNALLHASLPGVHEPRELVMLSSPDQSGSWTGRWDGRTDGPRAWLTYSEFEQLRDTASSFSAVMASQSSLNSWHLRVDGGAWEEARGRLVSGGFFDVLGIKPQIGRLFTSGDDRVESPHAVISHTYWQRRFGGRPDALGTTFTIRNATLTVIGVAPRGFIGETMGQQPDFWLPLRMQPRVMAGAERLHDAPPSKTMWLHVFGRLKPGVTAAQAEAEANGIFRAGLISFYGAAVSGPRGPGYLDQRLQIHPAARGASPARGEFSQSLTALLAAVGVLLLVACANLANLLLARGASRMTEMAVRVSLGARRERLIRQLVTESLALAALGGVAAVVVAHALHVVLVRKIAESDERFQVSFGWDPLVLAFLAGTTIAAALLFGVLPAWQVSRTDAAAGLREQSRGAVGPSGQIRSGRLLVSLQLALSLPLLFGAGLLARTATNLQRADLGFPQERLLLVRVDLRDVGYDVTRRDAVLQNLLERFQQIPGVRAASLSQLGLFSGGESSNTIDVEGYTPKGDRDRGSNMDVVGPGYFAALGVPMRQGRDIAAEDRGEAPNVAVVNEAFARQFLDRRNPVGLHLTTVEDDIRTEYRIVGVASDARTKSLRGDVEPRFFVAAHQASDSMLKSPTFLIRAGTETGPVLSAVRRTIQQLTPTLPIMSGVSLEEQMAPLTAQDRTTAQLAFVFGAVAVALAAIGLYGVLSYGVARRTGEIAIRIALGARPGRVVAMIMRETSGVVAIGVLLGAGLAFWASRLIDSRLYGVPPHDPLTLMSAIVVLVVVALCATCLPALRASRLNPMTALRS